jgi:hypothetical protein
MKRLALFVCALFLLPGLLHAQGQPPSDRKTDLKNDPRVDPKKDIQMMVLEERVRSLEAEVDSLKGALKAVMATVKLAQPGGGRLMVASAPARPPAGSPTEETASASAVPVTPAPQGGAQVPNYGGSVSAAKALNPDISVIGDFLGAIGNQRTQTAGFGSPQSPVPALEMHETEVGFQEVIDPYARADVFISFGESGVNVEEAYLTFTSLPGGFVARVGKMRAAFGKVNTIHNHALPWTDRPMVTNNLLGGEDGIDDAGLSITRILPAPKGIFLEGTAQVFRGDSENLFSAARRQDVSYVAHLRGYRDLNESNNIDIGFSYSRGHSAPTEGMNDVLFNSHTNLYGLDATYRWKPLRRSIYHSFLARAEFVWSHRDQLSGLALPEIQKAFGFYASGEYRVNRRWTIGGRYDRSDRSRDASLVDSGFSALVTYWPSEFSQIRGQYRFARYAPELGLLNRNANELRFQFLFVMGAHGAHPF